MGCKLMWKEIINVVIGQVLENKVIFEIRKELYTLGLVASFVGGVEVAEEGDKCYTRKKDILNYPVVNLEAGVPARLIPHSILLNIQP